jgi:hypothetical protein
MSNVASVQAEPATGIDRRGLFAAAGGLAVAGVLPTAAPAQSAPFESSADYREVVRIIGAIYERWDRHAEIGKDEDQREKDVAVIERRLALIEQRVLSKPTPSLDDMRILAALMLYWSDCGFDPAAPLTSCAQGGDCFERRALNLAVAVFKATGMGGANV